MAALPDAAQQQADRALAGRFLDDVFGIPPEWPLPESLRQAGQAIVSRQRPVLETRTLSLIETYRQRGFEDLGLALTLRLRNEVALLQLDTAGPAHDAWRRQVATVAGPCRHHYTGAKWAEALLWIAQLPERERAAALAHEEQVVARWGRERPDVPKRPTFSLDAYAAGWLQRLRTDPGGPRPPHSLVPVVAYRLLKDEPESLSGDEAKEPQARAFRCAVFQWALANAAAEAVVAPAELWAAYRYAMIERAEDWGARMWQRSPGWKPADLDAGEYPALAQRMVVTGQVRVRVKRDAQGRVVDAAVVGRNVAAQGLEQMPPVFIETLLDNASVRRARALPPATVGTQEVEMAWRLE